MKDIHIQVQEAQRVPNKLEPKRPTPRHIIIKVPKVKHKERILKAARGKQRVTYKGVPINLSADFSKDTLHARRACQKVFKVMKGKDLQPRLLYPAKLSFIFFIYFLIFIVIQLQLSAFFSPFFHPTPAKPTSLPHLHPPPWFCPWVLYSSSCNPLSPLSPPHSPLAIVKLFLTSVKSLVIFCLLFCFVDYAPVKVRSVCL